MDNSLAAQPGLLFQVIIADCISLGWGLMNLVSLGNFLSLCEFYSHPQLCGFHFFLKS